jgi:Fe-S-cluster containining protein
MEPKTGDSMLDKYGLGDLKTKHVSLWTDSDYKNILDACRKENVSPQLPLLFNNSNIKRLLEKSHCRRCGRCCGWGPNPLPSGPGVFLFDTELKLLSQHSNYSWKQLKKKTISHESTPHASYLPFPCIFRLKDKCQVYEARPFPCRAYPLSNYLLNGKYYIAVNVQCEYGSDIYRAVLSELAVNSATESGIPYES